MFDKCVLKRGAMLLLLVAALAGACRAEYTAACSKTGRTSMSVSPSTDGVPGRYVVRYCAPVDDRVTKWDLIISSINQSQQNCSYDILEERFSGTSHSHSIEFVTPLHLNCSHVCFSKAMDLLFRSCYRVVNQISRDQLTMEPDHDYFFADNNITKYERDTPQFVNDFDYDTMVSFHWYEGHIPITDYDIFMWPNNSHSEESESVRVSGNCSRVGGGVRCALRPAPGCYTLQLRHRAPWVRGFRDLATYDAHLCHQPSSLPRVSAARGSAWWAGGGALLAVGGALLAGCWLRARRARRHQLRVLRDWRIRQLEAEQKAAAAAACAGPDAGGVGRGAGGCVLLLYARECAAARRLARALASALRERAEGEVYDIHSPELTALAAGAPAAWLRAALAAPHVRLLLLQTPALQALHADTVPDNKDSLTVSPGPAGRGAAWGRPRFGDALLQHALRLLAETEHLAHTRYRKFYLATVSQLSVDLFPTIVPYTRFELPGATLALVRAVCGVSETASAADTTCVSETALQRVADAAAELVDYVRENPDYLANEIMFL